jgi:hypothetical protein
MTEADPLAAALERVRHRADGDDSRVLLAAVEAALAVHALTGYHRHTEPCYEHRDYGRARSAGCPDCKVFEWTGCDTCKDEFGNPARAEDCKTRQAIASALTGEEARWRA